MHDPMDEAAAEYCDPRSLRPWPGNPRNNEDAVGPVADSILRFGFGAPIVARRANREVIAGHTRLKAALKLGLERVPVRFLDIGEHEAHALALGDNKLGELATWSDALPDVLRSLREAEVDVSGLGWSQGEADDMMEPEPEPEEMEPEPEEGVVAATQPGEVYVLGPHRLVCGDARDQGVWEALLGPERLHMVWTDPPYGVAYVGKTSAAMTIENDDLDNDGLDAFLRDVFAALLRWSAPGAPWYVAAPPGPPGIPFAVQLQAIGLFRQRLAWVKDRFVLGHADYHYRHEDIYYGITPAPGRRGRGGVGGWFADNAQDTVFEVPRPSANRDHPTMKPVELVERCIRNSSEEGGIIGDAFGGSGTTLVAAARTRRVARVVELSPVYCDVIRRRWTAYALQNHLDPGPGALALP